MITEWKRLNSALQVLIFASATSGAISIEPIIAAPLQGNISAPAEHDTAAPVQGDDAKDQSSSIKALRQEIDDLYCQGDYQTAIRMCRDLLVRLEQRPGTKDRELDDVHRLKASLTRISGLDPAAGAELARAMCLDDEIDSANRSLEYQRALELALEQHAIRERHLGSDAEETGDSLHWLARIYRNFRRYDEAEATLFRVEQNYENRLGKTHPKTIGCTFLRGSIFAARGNVDEARRLFLQAREAYELAEEADLSIYYEVIGKLSQLERRSGDLEAALALSAELMSLCEQGIELERPLQNHIRGIHAGNLLRMGQDDEAEALLMRILEQDPDNHDHINTLAVIHVKRGQLTRAEICLRKARSILSGLGQGGIPVSALYSTNVAHIYVRQGKFTEAEELLLDALSIVESSGDNYTHTTTLILHTLGVNCARQKRYEEALEYLGRALVLAEKRQGRGSLAYVSNLGQMGGVYRELERYDEAEAHFTAVQEIFDEMFPGDHIKKAGPLVSRSKLFYDQKLYSKSVATALAAVNIYKNLAIENDEKYMVTGEMLGAAFLAQNRLDLAEKCYVLAAVYYEKARRMVGQDYSRSAFRRSPYRNLAALRLLRGREEEAWYSIEKGMGRYLTDALFEAGRSTNGSLEKEPAELDELENRLLDSVCAEARGEDTAREVKSDVLLARLEERERAGRIADVAALSAGPLLDDLTLTLAAVQKQIDDDTALIGWLNVETAPKTYRTWAYLIRAEGPVRWVEVNGYEATSPERMSITMPGEFVERLRVEGESPEPVTDTTRTDRLGDEIYRQWLAPVIDLARDASRLVFIYDDPLLGLPVEALRDNTGCYLGERYEISYAPSASIYAWLRHAAVHGKKISRPLLIGGPTIAATGEPGRITTKDRPHDQGDEAGETAPTASASRLEHYARLDRQKRGNSRELLPWSAREITDIARLFPGAVTYVGDQATEQNLRQMAADGTLLRHDAVHIATHVLIDDQVPQRSRIVLSDVSLDEQFASVLAGGELFDGMLTAGEIGRDWRIDADLVTLSACESGLGRHIEGEGYIGLNSAFFQAGARSLVVSLWKVDDHATCLLMRRFYENLAGRRLDSTESGTEPMSKAASLREAKQWLREYSDPRGYRPFRHPAYWSSFVLLGAPE